MKRLHKAAAVLFAAAILCSYSVFVFAAEDDWGDEWETEEISASEAQENSQPSADLLYCCYSFGASGTVKLSV